MPLPLSAKTINEAHEYIQTENLFEFQELKKHVNENELQFRLDALAENTRGISCKEYFEEMEKARTILGIAEDAPLTEEHLKKDGYKITTDENAAIDFLTEHFEWMKTARLTADDTEEEDTEIHVTPLAPPKVHDKKTFDEIWKKHVGEDLANKYITELINGKDTAAGFHLRPAEHASEDPVMTVTSKGGTIKGNWRATPQEKAKLFVAGLLAQGVDPKTSVVSIDKASKELEEALRKELGDNGFHCKAAPAAAAPSTSPNSGPAPDSNSSQSDLNLPEVPTSKIH